MLNAGGVAGSATLYSKAENLEYRTSYVFEDDLFKFNGSRNGGGKKKRGGKDGDDKMEKRAKGVTADQPAKD